MFLLTKTKDQLNGKSKNAVNAIRKRKLLYL